MFIGTYRSAAGAVLLLLAVGAATPVRAGETLVAVAANFADTAGQLAQLFSATSGHRVTFAAGATGKLYAQIVHGAPFDALLAADAERPRILEDEGRAVAGTRFTYALGRLALWSPDPARIGADGAAVLRAGYFRALAVANPVLAPYGAAARETLERLGLYESVRPKLVMGENAGQAFALVATGNAELGFVALASVLSPANTAVGSRWEVPAELHAPIRQDAVLLRHGETNGAARAFLSFLGSARAREIIRAAGYDIE